jgi:ubiquinone biosynthesis protein
MAAGKLEFTVHAIDEDALIDGIQKVANRITMGLVLAALIIGAALVMRVDTPYTLFGYPALAMILFLGAVAGGVLLVFDIWRHDRRVRRRVRERLDE